MTYLKKITALMLCMLVLFSVFSPVAATDTDETVTVLFTHDLHSHFLPVSAKNGESGGYARLYTLIEQERLKAGERVITLDAGDFSMGSLFQSIYATDAAELRILGEMGFDATTLGNHEFDFRQSGLHQMLSSAIASGDPLPALVVANYAPHAEGEDGYTEDDALTRAAYDAYGVRDYVMIEKGGIRFAVFGIMGHESHEDAPMSGMKFSDPVESARRVVAEIRANEDYDYIICLSHSGTESDLEASEDYILAESVDGIDVIVSGHSHTTLKAPVSVNGTYIVSCGSYAKNLGVLKLRKTGDKSELVSYELIPVNETVKDDERISAIVADYKELVSEHYLSAYGLSYDEVIAIAPFDFDKVYGEQADKAIGNLIADSYWYIMEETFGEDVELAFTVNAAGVIRDTFYKGEITASDAFNVLSLGVGADGTAGYPLVSAYLYGRELKDAMEVDASVVPLMGAAQLYGKGMYWKYNTNRMIFNKVVETGQTLEDGTVVELEDDKLYRIVTGLYCCQMLSTVNSKSFGILSLTPRNADGTPVTDYDSLILHDANGNEIKEWYALASYLSSFEKNEDGVSVIPERYATPEARKVSYASSSLYELTRNANLFTWLVILIPLIFVAIIALVVWRVVVRIRRKKKAAK
ncbi:MAG: bifunctional metallophosphatase/5'-nucleotidase [Clostridia bacterium]|nr:bifunctional metallophosphatase/5'-nucleotidase [Clostridia bacterium]